MFEKIDRLLEKIGNSGPWPVALFIWCHHFGIYAKHFPTISFSATLRYACYYAIGSILISCILYVFVRKWKLINLTALILLISEFYYGILRTQFKSIIGTGFLTSHKATIIILLLFWILTIYLIHKGRMNKALHLIVAYSIIMICYSSLNLLYNLQIRSTTNSSSSYRQLTNPPNIVLIVLDQYAGTETLRGFFQYDNSNFSQKMRALDFQEVQHTNGLYNSTAYTMASLFQMEPLSLKSNRISNLENQQIAFRTINDNRFIDYLHSNRYKIYNLSIFPFANIAAPNSNSPLVVGEKLLYHYNTSSTLWRDLSHNLYTKEWFGFNITSLRNDWIQSQSDLIEMFKEKVGSLQEEYPTFIYLHLMIPHSPYLLNSKGEPNPSTYMSIKSDKNLYLEYLKYGNKLTIELLKNLEPYNQNTITILMSDHGYSYFTEPTEQNFEFNNILFVKGLTDSIPDGISSQNTFPYILDQLYDTTIKKSENTVLFLYD